jgi:hypothetical protein
MPKVERSRPYEAGAYADQEGRDKAIQRKVEIDHELTAIERELTAIDAYAIAKGGRLQPARRRPDCRTKGRRARYGRRLSM